VPGLATAEALARTVGYECNAPTLHGHREGAVGVAEATKACARGVAKGRSRTSGREFKVIVAFDLELAGRRLARERLHPRRMRLDVTSLAAPAISRPTSARPPRTRTRSRNRVE
jgi:hypothetical protein